MLQFNTAFLLKATAICAWGCLPMSLNKESGFVWTADALLLRSVRKKLKSLAEN